MLKIRKGNIEYEKQQKQAAADHEKTLRNADMIEYIAMMTDVDIPEEGSHEQEV